MKNIVISLYDFTGEAVKPWAMNGFECLCFDIQHIGETTIKFEGGGCIRFIHADLHDYIFLSELIKEYSGRAMHMMAFPVCTDLAVSGAAHFETKSIYDPLFQEIAATHAKFCGYVGDKLQCPYFIENPVSVLVTLWRQHDYSFNPNEYGGYIPESEANHPTWPEYIAPMDAYPKKTCLWVGGGYRMPSRKPVGYSPGYSKQHLKLGGKSQKTKNIRSATPRGFALASYQANHDNDGLDQMRLFA